MLDAVVANFIDTVEEREFDAPFMVLLRAHRFYDIHFLHGQFEFGKDFIAKRVDEDGTLRQYVFQSKAGNLNLSAWTSGLGQIEMLRRNQIAHPGFDSGLPRQAILAMTGRLLGGAAPDAQDYCQQCIARGEVPLEVWDRERLIEFVQSNVNVGLAGRTEGPLLGILASTDARTVTDHQIEEVSRRWCEGGQEAWPCAIECAIIAARLHKTHRLDLASIAGLSLVRAGCVHVHDGDPPDGEWVAAADLGKHIFATYAKRLWERMPNGGPDPATMIAKHGEAAALITHAVRSVRIAEIIGLLGLLDPMEGLDLPSYSDVAAWMSRFLHRQRAAASPISDRWAVAMIPPVLLLAKAGHVDRSGDYLRELLIWVSQRYRQGIGLSGPNVGPDAEVRQAIGNTLPPGNLPRCDESQLATTILDLTAFLGLNRLYSFARNEFQLVKALPSAVVVEDSTEQYSLDSRDVSVEVNASYANAINGEWTSAAPHLRSASKPRYLQRIGRSWDHLAVSAVLRDRHFVCAWTYFV